LIGDVNALVDTNGVELLQLDVVCENCSAAGIEGRPLVAGV